MLIVKREIKKRFLDDIIQQLLALQWWNWDIERITKNAQHLTGNDIHKLLENA